MGSRTTKSPQGILTTAAAAFEEELGRYEELCQALTGTPLDSQKGLQRSKGIMQECAETEQRLAERLNALLGAMRLSQTRQQKTMEETLAAARKVQERVAEFATLMERFAALGLRAKDVNDPVTDVLSRKASGALAGDLLGGLKDVAGRMGVIAEEAESTAKDARAAGWVDIAREADALRQQVQAARNRVLLAQEKVAAQAPS
jgi:hypothetical protein